MTLLETQKAIRTTEARARQMAAAIQARAIKDDSDMMNVAGDQHLLTVSDTQRSEIAARRFARTLADTAALFVRLAEAREDQVSRRDMEERIRSFGAFAGELLKKIGEVGMQVTPACSASRELAEATRTNAIQPLMMNLERRIEEEQLWLDEHRLKAWQQALADLSGLCTDPL